VTIIKIPAIEFQLPTSVSIAKGSTYIVPRGIYYVKCGTNIVAEWTPDGLNWYTIISAGNSGILISDGVSVRLRNTSTKSSDSATIQRIIISI